MKLLNKTLKLENNKFKIIGFDKNRYEKNNRTHLYYLIQCKTCGEIFSRKKIVFIILWRISEYNKNHKL